MEPQSVSDMELAFPADVSHLMLRPEEIPEKFWNWNDKTKWNKMFDDMFFLGIKNLKLYTKEGIDKDKAWRHIRTVAGSREPKHEQKTAACAYMMSLWFEDAEYEVDRR